MQNRIFLFLFLVAGLVQAQTIKSPNGTITARFYVEGGKPYYSVSNGAKQVILPSELGVVPGDSAKYRVLTLVRSSAITAVKDQYSMINAKKSAITYTANRQVFDLSDDRKNKLQIIFQVSNDGVAFRYHFPGGKEPVILRELTAFTLDRSASGFLQPKAEAQTGFEHTNPSYEENYHQDVPAGRHSPTGWVYPALFRTGENWVLITEAGMDGSYCGTSLYNARESSVYRTNFPDKREEIPGQGTLPANVTYTPWRVIVTGSLKTIVESTLGTDVAPPAVKLANPSFVKPGKASWSWIMSKDDSITFTETKRYIDFASRMKWQYCLIDADWDTRIGYDKVKELAGYASTKNVQLLVWYNSAGNWNTVKMHPKNMLLTEESRAKEFQRLEDMGVKGIKVDFFGGDGRSMIGYYLDILNSAAKYQLLVNFHGATLPRGWARTYPHLMTTEAVKGFEMVTFSQGAANDQPNHAAMLPFTRNAFDPMDFTPMNLYKIPNSIVRKTTGGFELATSVLFLSGIQHYAESPAGMEKVPDFVVSFLQQLPDYWDDVRFLDGYPGKYAVIARKGAGKWYVAGINGENVAKTLTLDLSALGLASGKIIMDDDNGGFIQRDLSMREGKISVTLKPNGGFTIVP
jgi:alpha-glucosidase